MSWKPGDRHEATEAMIRVDQAGEFGAIRIYAGQLAVFGDRHPAARAIHHMAAQEERHRAFFDAMIVRRGVRHLLLRIGNAEPPVRRDVAGVGARVERRLRELDGGDEHPVALVLDAGVALQMAAHVGIVGLDHRPGQPVLAGRRVLSRVMMGE